MDISAKGIISKLERHAELLGAGTGAFLVWGPGQVLDSAGQLLSGNVHMPNLTNMVSNFFSQEQNKGALLSGIGLYIAGEVWDDPTGKALARFGKGLIEGTAVQHLLWWMTHSDEGCTQPGYTRPSYGGSGGASAPTPGGYSY